MSNKTYDVLKFVALVLLPAATALYLGLGQAWNWPNTDKVVTSLVLVDTFLGALLQIDSIKYKNDISRMDGFLAATGNDPDTGLPNLQLVVTTPPEELLKENTVRLKVGTPPEK